jgi:hypothetical protein
LTPEESARLELLFEEFRMVVQQAHEDEYLSASVVDYYLTNAERFVRWAQGEFRPGQRNMRNRRRDELRAQVVRMAEEVATGIDNNDTGA